MVDSSPVSNQSSTYALSSMVQGSLGGQPQPMQAMPMVMMTPQLLTAKKDLTTLKKLKSKDCEYEVFCPMCENRGFTKAVQKRSQAQWLGCIGFACCGCWLGCCLIPFCIRSIGDTVHFCNSCNHPLGKKSIGGLHC